MIAYDRRAVVDEMKMVKKQIKFDWNKFLNGAKRPAIALLVALLVAWGLDSELSGVLAGLIVERGISTASWMINKK